MLWVLILLVTVLGGAFLGFRVAKQRRPALPAPDATALLERTLKDVRPNDIVQYDGKDYLVEGVVLYEEDGHTWRCARMVDAGAAKWLLIGLERGGLLTARLLAPASLEVTGYPPESLDFGGATFKLDKRGTATASFQGEVTGLPGAGDGGSLRCRWWKYQAAGEKVLLVEQWGDIYRVLAGESVKPDDVELLAAS
jgi:hypothetical protein